MPVLDPIKAALTDHLQTLIKKMTIGYGNTQASNRDGGSGNPLFSNNVEIQKIDERTLSMTAIFDSQLTTDQTISEVVLHGDNPLDTPAFRATFMPITKNTTNEVRIDVLMEVR